MAGRRRCWGDRADVQAARRRARRVVPAFLRVTTAFSSKAARAPPRGRVQLPPGRHPLSSEASSAPARAHRPLTEAPSPPVVAVLGAGLDGLSPASGDLAFGQAEIAHRGGVFGMGRHAVALRRHAIPLRGRRPLLRPGRISVHRGEIALRGSRARARRGRSMRPASRRRAPPSCPRCIQDPLTVGPSVLLCWPAAPTWWR